MDIVIDFSAVSEFLNQPADVILIQVFKTVGWIPVAIVFVVGAFMMWMDYIHGQFMGKQKFVFLAIDIPKNNVQSPKAVENLFTYLGGAHGTMNLIEEYWEGKLQLAFSFEIVSIGGYTQFVIRTPENFRHLIETAIYSQYSDAEITEINDYTEGTPDKFPDDEYDVWGSEFMSANDQVYPIKTYIDFESSTGKPEEVFKDPMASLMDMCSSLHTGEQFWFQIVVKPIGFEWVDGGEKEIKKILKEKASSKRGFADKLIDLFMSSLEAFGNFIINTGTAEKTEDRDESLKMMDLKPGEKERIESIHTKTSKQGFECKMRMVYIAKKDVMNKPKVVNGFVGYIKQFMNLNINNIKPDTKKTMTSTAYFMAKSRLNTKKSKIVRAYKSRSGWAGRMPRVLNIEELATLWHFPVETAVKAPMIQKTVGRKVEAPMQVPFSDSPGASISIGGSDFDRMMSGDTEEALPAQEIKNEEKKKIEDITTNESVTVKSEDDIFADLRNDAHVVEKKTIVDNEPDKGAPPANLPFA